MSSENISPLGVNVSRYRKAEGLSAADLADLAGEGLSRSVLANLENGRKDDVTVKQLIALATALKVPPAALIVDLMRPWEETPYRHPSITTVSMTLDGSIQGSAQGSVQSAMTNLQFFQWVGGHEIKPKKDTTGARKTTDIIIPALLAFNRSIFDLLLTGAALEQARDFKDDGHNNGSDLKRVENAERAFLISASNALQWNELLTALGIEEQDTEVSVRLVLAKFGLSPEALVDHG